MIHRGLIVRTERPINAETKLAEQVGVITPTTRFYIRNHFDVPRVEPGAWSLTIGGLVRHPMTLALSELQRLPSRSVVVTLECAGNGRCFLNPPVSGEPWDLGAVSTAEWTGVPLVEVLDRAGVQSAAREIVFRALDQGPADGESRPIAFERSLPVDWALNPDVLLAYGMNGEALPPEHGFPLRLIVPGWYAMASVKWLAGIEAVERPFTGHFQSKRYVIQRSRNRTDGPVTQLKVRSVITRPDSGDVIRAGELVVRGYAWSGHGRITRVEVDAGHGWQAARLLDQPLPHAWRRWELTTRVAAGRHVLRTRATDAASNTQPDEPPWNQHGYANNAIHEVGVVIVE